MNRAKETQDKIDEISMKIFGTKADGKVCVDCKKQVDISKMTAIEKKEFDISGLCAECQRRLWEYAESFEV